MKNLNPWILNLGIIYHSLILLFCFFSQSNVFCIPFFPRALCVCTHWHSQLNAFLTQAASVIIKQSHTFDWTYCVETHQTVLKRSPSFDRWTVLPSVLTLSLPVFSTLAATLNTSLMHCQMHIQKGQLFFKSACQVHPSPERGFENGWRERERERERERGERSQRERREEQETRRHHQPIYLTAIYHSESMCQQLCACFMVDWLPPPLLLLLVQSCIGALCVCTEHQEHIRTRRAAEGTDQRAPLRLSYGSTGWQFSHHGSLLLPDPPQVQEEEEETLRAQRYSSALYLLLCLPVRLSVCLFECQETRATSELCCRRRAIVLVLFDCRRRRSDESLRAPFLKVIGRFQSRLCCPCSDDSVCSTLMCWRENWSNTEVSDISLLIAVISHSSEYCVFPCFSAVLFFFGNTL